LRSDIHCTLIVLYPRESHAVYLDSGSATRKNYDAIKEVLDDALTGFSYKEPDLMNRKKTRGGAPLNVVHKTDFPCAKQPEGSVMEAFYAIHHMREFVRDQEQL